MPLKLMTVAHHRNFYVRGTVGGRRIYESTRTSNRKEAEQYLAKRHAELWTEHIYGQRAIVTFRQAVTAYLEAEQRSPATQRYLERLLAYFGDAQLSKITQACVDKASQSILTDAASARATTKIRSVITPLRSVLEFAAIRGWCDRPAFKGPRTQKARTAFLRPEEATRLVRAAAPHLQPLLIFLIGTGCRMSEAMELDWQSVDLKGARCVVWQKQGNERHVDLPPVVIRAMVSLAWREGRVFRPGGQKGASNEAYHDTGRRYGGQIKSGWSYACKRAGLPGTVRRWTPKSARREKEWFVPDITPHGLRHTWASWHYCIHKDIMRLQYDGGWSTVAMVSRYAKLMPDVYRDEIIRWWREGPEGLEWPEGEPSPSGRVSVQNEQAASFPPQEDKTLLLARALLVAQEIIERQYEAIISLERAQK
ncbi:tyrosine-type recombinase/integrase [Acetobacter persici]|uniref:tyrosine-type recombinase/integrase n=1 Tax=Acetobacter persici TaxID=1076596 RepID=UPI0036DB10A4